MGSWWGFCGEGGLWGFCGELVGNWFSLLPYLLSRLLNDDLVFSIALSVK